jgi:hypothetical protein
MLTRQCGEDVGGLYNYEGAWYLLGLTFKAQEDHQDHHDQQSENGGTATETATDTATDGN